MIGINPSNPCPDLRWVLSKHPSDYQTDDLQAFSMIDSCLNAL